MSGAAANSARPTASPALFEDFQSFFSLSGDLLCMGGLDGRFHAVNPAWTRVLGYTSAELTGSYFVDYIHPEDLEATHAAVGTVGQGVEVTGFRNRYRCRDGSYKWLQWTSRFNRERGVLYGIARDVTEQVEQEQQLRAREEELLVAQSISGIGSWEMTLPGGRLTWSLETHRIFGTNPSTFLPTSEAFYALVHPADRPFVERTARRARETQQNYECEHRIVRSDGSERTVVEHARFFFDAVGQPARFIGTVQDVTEQKLADAFLIGQKEVFQLLAGAGPETDALDKLGRVVEAQLPGSTVVILEANGGERMSIATRTALLESEAVQLGEAITRAFAAELAELAACRPNDARQVRAVQTPSGCWFCYPILSGPGHLLGALAIRRRAQPFQGRDEAQIVQVASSICAVAFERRRGAAELQKSNERFELLSRATIDVMWDWDLRVNRLDLSQNFEKRYGYLPSELGSGIEAWSNGISSEDAERVKKGVEAVLAGTGTYWEEEYRFRRKDGSFAEVLDRGFIVRDQNGVGTRMVGMMIDISTRKAAERERMRLLDALEASLNEIYIFDPVNFRLEYVNAGALANLGYTREQALRLDFSSFQDELSRGQFRERVRPVIEGTAPQALYETTHRRANGSTYTAQTHLQLVQQQGRSVLFAVVLNTTAQKEAQAKIREQAELLDRAQEAIMVCDLGGQISYANRFAEVLYGWECGEMIGRSILMLGAPRDIAAISNTQRVVMQRGDWSGEMEHQTKEGKLLTVDSRWTLVREENNQPKAMLLINTDITERKKLEAHFLRAQRMESIGTLAGGIAHDLNNVLTPIMMSLPFIRDQVKDPGTVKIINSLETTTERGADIIRQLLAFARGREGKREPLSLRRLVRDIESIVRETFPKSIKLKTSVAEDLWNVVGDYTQLYQVLMNLAVNARDAMPHGGVLEISVANHHPVWEAPPNPNHADDPFVVLRVADTGAGIPSELLDKVFDPFFTTKDVGRGTGLGLPTAMTIVKNHAGYLNLQTEVGKGTQFTIYLPAIPGSHLAPAVIEVAEDCRGNGELILIAEDEEPIRVLAKTILEANGYRTLVASNGAEAIALFAANPDTHAVISDMMMPHLDGTAALKALRKLNPEIKALAISGNLEQRQVTENIDSGPFVPMLQKPFTAVQLLASLHKLLRS